MKFHKEGTRIIFIAFVLIAALSAVVIYLLKGLLPWQIAMGVAGALFFGFICRFFRVPKREYSTDANAVFSSCDGRVVAIEEVEEPEYYKGKRLQVSIFMSVNNVHINWFPISGIVKYYKYHPGKFLVAWHPKSSTLNERTTTVVETADGKSVLIRQIAGFLARRIVNYADVDQAAQQAQQMGFIKFGSRVDFLLPLDVKMQVSLEDKVVGGKTVIATFN